MYHKRRRLMNYDYASNGAYFVTFCTYQKMNYFWKQDRYPSLGDVQFTECGLLVQHGIEQVSSTRSSVLIDNYVIMPNHVHLIIVLNDSTVTISNIVRYIKSQVTRHLGSRIFQPSFHDRIIRNADEYEKIWNYIEDNPRKWNEDKYFWG